MALTNVAMLTDQGWKSVTIEEAKNIFPSTVSAHSEMLMCRLCKQHVTLTAPGNKTRHFRHDSSISNKECDDRALSSTVKKFELHDFIPPIRLVVVNDHSFFLEMGFILPPILNNKSGSIVIRSNESHIYAFRYDISRFSIEQLNYLSIGNKPCKEYEINVIDSQISLPNKVEGINNIGVLFDIYTRKKLPEDADVIVNRDYILLTSIPPSVASGIIISKECSMNGWRIYKVRAKTFSKSTANFFLRYGYLLTEKQASLSFLWPEYIVSPYVIKHKTEKLYVYIQGESIIPKIFPTGNIICCKYCDNDNGVAVTVESNERLQLLSAGRTKVLRYTYLLKDNLDVSISSPVVKVTDIKGNDIISGNNYKLPEKRILQITTQFDGYIEINKDNWVIERRKVDANIIAEIDQIQNGMNINVFQGFECVWSVSYVRAKKSFSSNETELLFKLQNAGGKMIPISHVFGAVANQYSEYPKIKEWIYLQIRNGYISENAYKIIRGK